MGLPVSNTLGLSISSEIRRNHAPCSRSMPPPMPVSMPTMSSGPVSMAKYGERWLDLWLGNERHTCLRVGTVGPIPDGLRHSHRRRGSLQRALFESVPVVTGFGERPCFVGTSASHRWY